MGTVPFEVDLKDVDLRSLKSDSDFRTAARRLLPGVIDQISKQSAEHAWTLAQTELSSVPGMKLNKSATEKAKFIREASKSFSLDESGRRKTEDAIFNRLKELKAKGASTTEN